MMFVVLHRLHGVRRLHGLDFGMAYFFFSMGVHWNNELDNDLCISTYCSSEVVFWGNMKLILLL